MDGLNGYRQRQFRKTYTYKVGILAVRAIAAWGRLLMFIGAFVALPLFVLTAVLRKRKLIGIVLVTGFAHTTPFLV